MTCCRPFVVADPRAGLRLQCEMLAPSNPLFAWIAAAADVVRETRRPVASANSFVAMQEQISRQAAAGLGQFRQTAERLAGATKPDFAAFKAMLREQFLMLGGIRKSAARPSRRTMSARPSASPKARLPSVSAT